MARKVTCVNSDNLSIEFTDRFAPWLLENCDGIYESKNAVNTTENTMTDGSTYQGSNTRIRNIVLTLRDHPTADHEKNRAILYNIFKPKQPGTFIYQENDSIKQIGYRVESINIDSVKRARQATISLLCPDPFFTDAQETVVHMSAWVDDFEWQHTFTANGESFGHRAAELLKTIENNSATDDIGITITISASGTVENPVITHVEKMESIEIGTSEEPFEMQAGDAVVITTHTNNKHVYLERNGARTEINEFLSDDSVFIQLDNGANTFGYSADNGAGYMTISISFRYRYLGV